MTNVIANQTVVINIKDKTYNVFFRNGNVSQIHSVGGKTLAYVQKDSKNGQKIATLAIDKAV